MLTYQTWQEAYKAAQERADRCRRPMGIEKTREFGATVYRIFALPLDPTGYECRAERVDPMRTTAESGR